MPYKDEGKKIFDLKFLFRSRYFETLSNKCLIHNAIVLYVSDWPVCLGNR